MNKVSEKSASNSRLISSFQSDNGQYQKYKQEYEKFTQKTDKSDLANSPVLISKKLDLLAELKESAEEENLTEELSWIEDEMTRLKSSLTSITSESTDNPTYYQFDFQTLRERKAPLNIGKVLEACKDSDGTYDLNTVKMVMAFKNASEDDQDNISYIVKKCRNFDGTVSDKNIGVIETLSQAGVKPFFICNYLDSFLSQDENNNPYLNSDLSNKMVKVKSFGFDDNSSLALAKILSQGYSDEDTVIKAAQKMSDAKISFGSVLELLNLLTVSQVSSDDKFINSKAVDSIISLKKLLCKTRLNERNERLTPLGKYYAPTEITALNGLKDGFSFYKNKDGVIYPVKIEPNVMKAKMEYDSSISAKEDEILKYTAKNYLDGITGEIKTNPLRVMSVLRGNGITYDALLPLTEMCLDKPSEEMDFADRLLYTRKPDMKTLNLVKVLHDAGAQSKDIPSVIGAIPRDFEGNYDEEDVQNSCCLTQLLLGEPQLSQLLTDIKQSDFVRGFVFDAANLCCDDNSFYFRNRKDIADLVNMAKSDGKNIDEDTLAVIDEFLFDRFTGSDSQFMNIIRQFLPDMRQSEDVKEFIFNALDLKYDDGDAYFSNIKDIADIINLTKPDGENVDKDLLNLIGEFLFYEYKGSAEDFIELIKSDGFIPLVSKLLPDIQQNRGVMNFVFNAANFRNDDGEFYFENRQDIADLINMTKHDGKTVDVNSLNVIENTLFNDFNGPSKKFMKKISAILKKNL